MVTIIKQKRHALTIRPVIIETYRRRGRMTTIGKILRRLQSLFKPLSQRFAQRPWRRFGESETCRLLISVATMLRNLTDCASSETAKRRLRDQNAVVGKMSHEFTLNVTNYF
jgi:hypothetical protein